MQPPCLKTWSTYLFKISPKQQKKLFLLSRSVWFYFYGLGCGRKYLAINCLYPVRWSFSGRTQRYIEYLILVQCPGARPRDRILLLWSEVLNPTSAVWLSVDSLFVKFVGMSILVFFLNCLKVTKIDVKLYFPIIRIAKIFFHKNPKIEKNTSLYGVEIERIRV